MVRHGMARFAAAGLALAGFGVAWLFLVPAIGGRAPSPPQVIPDAAFHSVVVPTAPVVPPIRDWFPGSTPRPRSGEVPAPEIIVELKLNTTTPTIADAKAYAAAVLGPTQYACLDQIAEHESGWTTPDINPVSGAFGIPQAVPGSRMASAGPDWATNPITQVKWMLGYVHQRYGSACNAWAFWMQNRWY